MLIRKIKVYPVLGAATEVNPMEIWIGNDTPTTANPFVNQYCTYYDGDPKDGQIIELACAVPGIKGSVVTLHRINTLGGIRVMEIEVLGSKSVFKLLYCIHINNSTVELEVSHELISMLAVVKKPVLDSTYASPTIMVFVHFLIINYYNSLL